MYEKIACVCNILNDDFAIVSNTICFPGRAKKNKKRKRKKCFRLESGYDSMVFGCCNSNEFIALLVVNLN